MSTETLLKKARMQAQSGDLRAALKTVEQGLRQSRDDYRLWLFASELSLRAGQAKQALQAARKAAALVSQDAVIQVQLARALTASGDVAGARAAADAALQLDPSEPVLLDGIGAVYSACEEQSLALPLFERAVAGTPDNAHFLFNLATGLRFAGRFEEAESAVERCIALNPRDFGAHHLRSDLRRQTAARNHVRELEALHAASDLPWLGRVQLCHALAKEYEDLGDYERSFRYLEEGASLRRRHMKYEVQDDVKTMDQVMRLHTAEAYSRFSQGFANQEPIFILGLPRTGTTLVERILGIHSAVTAAGELRHFPGELVRLATAAHGGRALPRNELVEASLKIDMQSLGKLYVKSTRPKTGQRARFIDKLPLNFLYCGLIHAALPHAKIIHMCREPMDTCYAIYKTLFSRAYPFSYDLRDLGHYYVAYHRLMEHWHRVLPDVMLDVRYEELVADPELGTRRLLEYCGLEFEPACLEFHRSDEASTTASAVQVRQPVYTDSVGKWKNVTAQLEPCAQILRAAGIAVDCRRMG